MLRSQRPNIEFYVVPQRGLPPAARALINTYRHANADHIVPKAILLVVGVGEIASPGIAVKRNPLTAATKFP
jgi:hypothetical protein